MSLALPREPQANALSGDFAAPQATFTALPPFFAGAFFADATAAATTGGLCKDDFQIALLGGDPALDEAGGVLGEVLVELAFGVRLVEFLHQEGEVIVGADDGLQVCEVGF